MTQAIDVLIKQIDPDLPVPSYAHSGDAGLDLLSGESIVLKPGDRALVPTGIALAIPEGFAGYVQPRSGRAISDGLGIVNSPGLIDSGYRGEVKVIVINLDVSSDIKIERGDKVAQLVILPVPRVDLHLVSDFPATSRGEGGFGSTGR